MARFRDWLDWFAERPEPSVDADLLRFARGAYDAAEAIRTRYGLPDADPIATEQVLQQAAREAVTAGSATELELALIDYRRAAAAVIGTNELRNNPELMPTAMSARILPGGVPRGVAVSFGDTAPRELDPNIFIIKVQDSAGSLSDQVADGARLLAAARHNLGARAPIIKVLAASGDSGYAQECWFEALRETLEGLSDDATLIVDTPASAVENLRKTLNEISGRPLDLLLSRTEADDPGPSLWPVATKRIAADDPLSSWHSSPAAAQELIAMARRARNERQASLKAYGDMAALEKLISLKTHMTSEEFMLALQVMSSSYPWAPYGLPVKILALDDQEGGTKRAPYLVLGVGDPVTADRIELAVANDPKLPPREALRQMAEAHGDDIRSGTTAVALLLSGTRITDSTVNRTVELLRDYNPHAKVDVTSALHEAFPQGLPGPLRDLAQAARQSPIGQRVGAAVSRVRRRGGAS